MRLRFSFALLIALVALPAAAQDSAFLDGSSALSGRTADARRGGEIGEPFTGVLLGTKEVPANTSPARGYAYGQFDAETKELFVYAPVTGLRGTFQAAHIHSGAAGMNGPILYPAANVFTNGADVEIDFQVTLTDPQVVLLQAGNLYVNVHSSAFPDGEIRTQLVASEALNGVRAQPVGSTVSVLAYVARARGAFTYLNDGLGGIAVRQTSGAFFDAVQSGAVRPGTVVRVTGTTSEFNGLLQINGAALASFEVAQTLSENVNRFAEPVTLADIATLGEELESVLVAVLDVTLADGAGGTFVPGTSVAADDGSAPIAPVVVRVPNAADTAIPGRPIPTGPTAVLGVVGQFTTAVPATAGYQVLVTESYDVAPTAQVQIIHNSADPSLATVRIAAGETAIVPALSFRSATGPVEVAALSFDEIAVLDANGDAVAGSFNVLFPGEAPVLLVLQGVADPNRFAPNPDGIDTGLVLRSFSAPPAIAGSSVSVFGINGLTDAPAIDVRSTFIDLLSDVFYGDAGVFQAASSSSYPLTVFARDSNMPAGTFLANLSGLDGQSAVLLTSGFRNRAANQNGAAFALVLVRADGTTATFANTLNTAGEESPGTEALRIAADANPVRAQTAVRYALGADGPVRVSVVDALGREVAVLVQGDAAPGEHEATLRASTLAPGVYTLRLAAGGQVATSRVTVVR